MIKFHETYSSNKIKQNLIKLSDSNNFGSTYFRDSCTELLQDKFGYSNFLLTNSATSALEMSAILLKDTFEFERVIIPSYTFSSTANAFLRSGYNIEFVDIRKEDLMFDETKINKYSRNDLLVLVHYAGSSYNFQNLKDIGKEVKFIEDAAQGFGAKYQNQNLGSLGLLGCISFHPTKNIHAGFGGMLLMDEKIDFDKASFVYERGTDRKKVIAGLKNKYEWVDIGSSFEITELSAAVLQAQLIDHEKIIKIKKEIYCRYLENLKELIDSEVLIVQKLHREVSINFHSFYIILKEDCNSFLESLKSEYGIQSYIGYVPLHNSKYGKKNNLNKKLKITEEISNKVVRLPIHTGLKNKDIDYITDSIKNILL